MRMQLRSDVRMRCLALAVVAVTIVLVPTAVEAETPPHLHCGQVLTTDTTLHRDLVGCANEGLIIGADNITLNLNGHTVGGNGRLVRRCPDDAFCDVGIDDTAGHTGLVVQGGAIRGFDVGLFASGAGGSRIRHVILKSESSLDIVFGGASGFRIHHNQTLPGPIAGIVIFGSHGGRVDHNSVLGHHGYAIPSFDSDHLRIDHNVLRRNDHGILLDNSNRNVVRANRITRSGGSSLDIGHSNHNQLAGNLLVNDGDGIVLFEASDNHLRNNIVRNAGFFGFPDTGGFGMVFDGADHNLVKHNVITGTRGPALLVTSLDSQLPARQDVIVGNVVNSRRDDGIRVGATARAIQILDNILKSNGDDGIRVEKGATATRVIGNVSHRNHSDGIAVRAPGTLLARNVTNFNADLGIRSVRGVIDGGGNRAKGNGNPLQCTNISCS